MTKDDLLFIEKTLGVRLPLGYTTLMARSEVEDGRGNFWFRSLFAEATVVTERTVWLRDLMESYVATSAERNKPSGPSHQ